MEVIRGLTEWGGSACKNREIPGEKADQVEEASRKKQEDVESSAWTGSAGGLRAVLASLPNTVMGLF